jgi:tetratricopeptide (TPR) repeat protein
MTLEYLSMSRRAAADLGEQVVNRRTIEAIETMTSTSRPDSQLPNTLYELLIPADLKRDLADGTHLQLVVNEGTAQLPWEMLATAPQTNVGGSTRRTPVPLATQCGILRQLELPELLRRRTARAKGSDVFIFGNPPVGPTYPSLPGAAEEAMAARDLFADDGTSGAHTFTARGLIYDEAGGVVWDTLGESDQPLAVRVLNALMAHSYRVLHVAAHGGRDVHTGQYGIVVGPDDVLTAAELANLPYVPDLVFLNCCHLGRINPEIPANQLAANLAVSFMRIGVRAVVAAGWAVNDQAAKIFAQQLYGRLIHEGADLGSAVLVARRAIADSATYGNTYGAFQVYGDPAFRLTPAQPPAAGLDAPRTRSALLRRLQTLNVALGNAPARDDPIDNRIVELRHLHEHLKCLREAGEPSLGAFWAELGVCYRKVGDFESAIACYRNALQDAHGDASLEDAEQMANLLSRLASQAGTDQATFDEANNEAEHILKSLLGVAPSAERHGLLGGHRRRQALRLRRDQADLELLQYALASDAYGAVINEQFAESGYLVVNYVPLAALVALARNDTTHLAGARQVHERFRQFVPRRPPTDFFERVRATEVALSGAILDYVTAVLSDYDLARHEALRDLTAIHDNIIDGYLREFKQRSTVAERQSAIDALDQWGTIAEPHDRALADELHRMADDLRTAQS